MAKEVSNTEVDEFMASPIVTWFTSCLDKIISHKLTYDELVDGVLIYNVFLQMDIYGQSNDVSPSNNDHTKRLKNLEIVMRRMQEFYEEDSVILQQPDLRLIARAPYANVREVELLMCLLLGCAVKCPNKKHFIEKITLLDQFTQEIIASHIGKVMHFPDIVLCRDMLLVETTDLDDEEVEEPNYHTQKVYKAFEGISRIYKERNVLIEREEASPPPNIPHCVLELNEWKSKALQLKDIEEEYASELQKCMERLEAYEKENARLASEAKSAKDYRDALDAAMEKALQAERLEQEVARYREKLEHLESCKSRLEELKQDNQLLNENKEELAGQLSVYKAKNEKTLELEAQMYKLKEQCDKLTIENAAFRKKMAELNSANDELERQMKLSSSIKESLNSSFTAESDDSFNSSFNNNSICEQLSHSTQSHALKLELENRRLSKLVESFQENSFHESSFKILDLEKEKKRLELANEDLNIKVAQFDENLAAANREKMQLRVLLENSQKLGNGELESRIVALESEKKNALKELDKAKEMVKEKLASLEASSKIIKELQIKLQVLEKQRKQDTDDEDSGENLNTSILKSPPKHKILYDRLNSDYQCVVQERNVLKRQVRDAMLKLKRQNEIIEKLEASVKRMQMPGSPNALKQEHSKLMQDFSLLVSEYRKAESKADQLTKRYSDDQVEIRAKNVRIIELDLQNSKLRHKCEMLLQLNDRVESDKRTLMEYVSQMLKQNRELVAQRLEDKDHYHEEERKNNETVNHLSRAKEKLEEKIMDQYRRMDNRRELKKRSAAVSAVKNTFVKVRRAGSEFFGRSRRSWAEENSSPTEKSYDFEYTKAAENGTRLSEVTYINAPRNRKSGDFMDNFCPEKFSFDEKNNNC